MDEFFEVMRVDIQQMLEDRPCNKCGYEARCTSKCTRYEKWFSQIWRELRELYLGPGRGRK
jgi:hypothetical protein